MASKSCIPKNVDQHEEMLAIKHSCQVESQCLQPNLKYISRKVFPGQYHSRSSCHRRKASYAWSHNLRATYTLSNCWDWTSYDTSNSVNLEQYQEEILELHCKNEEWKRKIIIHIEVWKKSNYSWCLFLKLSKNAAQTEKLGDGLY